MADIVYQWNPFQERIDNDIKGEVIKTSATDTRREFVPRAAPFFSRGVVVRRAGSATPLTLGVDYVFGHPFDRFISKYKRNVFGSVIMLKYFEDVIYMDSSTIGGPFVLDQAAFAELVANIVDSPRIADWIDLVNVPTEFPSDPHDHPATQTYDYLEMMTQLRSLIMAMADTSGTMTVKDLLLEHMQADLVHAHAAGPADIALDLVANIGPGAISDLDGQSGNKLVTFQVMFEALRRLTNGTLNLN